MEIEFSCELFGFERVSDLLAAKPDALRATEAVVNFGQQDDITVLTLARLAAGEESRTEVLNSTAGAGMMSAVKA